MSKNKIDNQGGAKGRIFHPVAMTVTLMLILLMGNAFGLGNLTNADEASGEAPAPIAIPVGTPTQIDAQVENACVTELTKFADPEFEKYKIFMEDNFKNKSTTSSLLDLGMQRYEQFKTDITAKYQQLVTQQLDLAAITGSGVTSQAVGINRCNSLALQYVDDASKLLKMRALTTSGIKKASIFVEKYKQINDKLRALNLEVMKMTVNLSTFEQKLPCYLKSCA